MELLIFFHSGGRCSRILHGVGYKLIAKELVHLLESLSFGLWEEEPVAEKCDDVEDEEDVEVLELDRGKRCRGELGEDQVDSPVGEGSNGVAQGANFHRENLKIKHVSILCCFQRV